MHTILDDQIRLLKRLSPPIEAVGIGGSYGIRSPQYLSDLDFFIFLPSARFFTHLNLLKRSLVHRHAVAALPEPDFHPGFGFRLSYIFANGASIEYFVNCRETLNPDPMRAKTRIIFDRTGNFSRVIESISEDKGLLEKKLVERVAHDYLVELVKIRKFAVRKEIVPLYLRLDRLRRILLAVDRHYIRSELCSPHDADRNLEADLGHRYIAAILRTCPRPNYLAIYTAISAIRRRILRRLNPLQSKSFGLTPSFFEVDRKLFESIRTTLKDAG
jgi:hypothetical protein